MSLIALDETHDPELQSWVASANQESSDFPLQNLPYGRFRARGSQQPWRIGVAIGDQILDLQASGLFDADIPQLMAQSRPARAALRLALSRGLRLGSATQEAWAQALLPQAEAELTLPCPVGDYTDFYTSVHHATRVGELFRPDQPLLPNYKWVPIGYHGRASSLVASGQSFKRPQGQTKAADANAPRLGPSQRLDYELELAYFIGQGNALGEPIAIEHAEDHIFGVALLNDWSARDLQAWEYQPLGPFLSKNFASSVSPWLVTLEALAPFRSPLQRPADDPQPLPYLESAANRSSGALDITLEVLIQTRQMREAAQPAQRLSLGNASSAAYWTAAQLVAHHTVGGCNLQTGDLLGSGTLSGPAPQESGSLLELSRGGKQPITLLNGETRSFLQDGDCITLRAWCERPGQRRIGLGSVVGTVQG
jgi:fumarylacetoacetase